MTVPNWYELILLSLAAFRTFRLIAADTILDGPRERIIQRAAWQLPNGKYRKKLDEWVHCPWCMGFWVSLIWWGFYLITPEWSVRLAVPWAISAVVALVAVNLDD